jgi:hypothetical protein
MKDGTEQSNNPRENGCDNNPSRNAQSRPHASCLLSRSFIRGGKFFAQELDQSWTG